MTIVNVGFRASWRLLRERGAKRVLSWTRTDAADEGRVGGLKGTEQEPAQV